MKTLKSKIIALLAVLLITGAAYAMGAGATFMPRTATATPVLYSEEVTAIHANASPAVVEIKVTQQGGGIYGRSQGQGSGFLVDGLGHILTNNHVIEGSL